MTKKSKRKAPGRSYRKGITIVEFITMFPDDESAELFFEKQRWPDGRFCPDCGSEDTVVVKDRRPMPYRCRSCRHHFSVKKGTVMANSNLGCRAWLIAGYLLVTGIKGTSSMKIHRDLGISQKTAWHLMHRLREAFENGEAEPLPGPVEVDETYLGGKLANKPRHVRAKAYRGRGGKGPGSDKTMVVGLADRKGQVRGKVVEGQGPPLREAIYENVRPGAHVFTDENNSYNAITWEGGYKRESVNHSRAEYSREGYIHTNTIEGFWSLLKRGYHGTFHQFSPKHTQRYVNEFAGRQSIRDLGTMDQLRWLARAMVGKRLRYADLVG